MDFVVFLGMLVDFFAKDPFRGEANMPNGLLSNFVHAHKQISFFCQETHGAQFVMILLACCTAQIAVSRLSALSMS